MIRSYLGEELSLFSEATNFHRYYVDVFGSWITGKVLEVGAGMGAITLPLLERGVERITACEPDPELAGILASRVGHKVDVVVGGVQEVPSEMGLFDAIVYVDVIEHIEDDRAEIASAFKRLRNGGVLILAGPAHPWLYSPFDAAIGHYRRYNRQMVEALFESVPALAMLRFAYIDCVGTMLSLGNRWIGRQTIPSHWQVKFWDASILPVSQRLDRLLRYRIGKSFVAIARKSEGC